MQTFEEWWERLRKALSPEEVRFQEYWFKEAFETGRKTGYKQGSDDLFDILLKERAKNDTQEGEHMKKIEIETTYDTHDCETCGSSWAYGGRVVIDGEVVLEREPVSHCYGAPSFSESDLLVMALKKLGVTVMVDSEPYQIYSHDDEYHGEPF